jgi:hypothetical protein
MICPDDIPFIAFFVFRSGIGQLRPLQSSVVSGVMFSVIAANPPLFNLIPLIVEIRRGCVHIP